MKSHHTLRRARRGGILVSSIAFVAIASMLVVGMLTVATSYFARAKTESDYETALSLAEAGVNYEFRSISSNTANADQKTNGSGVTYSLGGGTFTVYCSNRDGTTPWVAPNKMYVTCTGTIHGVSRTLQVSGMGYGNAPDFAVFGIGSFKIHPSSPTINGDCGTDGTTSLHGHINGSYYCCGAAAAGGSGAGALAPTVYLPNPITYSTVDQVALGLFPNSGATVPGGLAYLATHNDNVSVGLPLTNATITSSITLKGPGNYYLTGVNLAGSSKITFDNTNGAINIWVGPSDGAGQVYLDGSCQGVASVPMSTHPVIWYVATTGGVQMHTSPNFTCDWYVYNTTSGTSYGPFSGWNSPVVNGSVLCYDFFNSGDTLINYQPGIPSSYNSIDHYGFDDQWLEVSGM